MSDTATLTLTDFLLARIAEDEGYAHYLRNVGVTGPQYGTINEALTEVVGRVLSDCEAKRRVVEIHTGNHECASLDDSCCWIADGAICETVRHLASPYADHPGYRDEWRPQP